MFESIQDLITGSAITYAVITGFVWLDAWLPVVPGESLIITGAVLSAQGELSIWLTLLAGLVGAVAGDNFTYLLGRRLGTRAAPRLFGSEKNRGRLAWAEHQLERRLWIILTSRFIPGGRTAVMFASGTFEIEWRKRFLPYELAAAALWTASTAALGYFFGSTFQDSFWVPLLASFGIAAAITVTAEVSIRRRSGADARDATAAGRPRSTS